MLSLKNKKVGIYGLGITGISVYKKLASIVQNLICYDDSEANIENFIKNFGSKHIVSIDSKKWEELHKVIVSPGILHSHQVFAIALKYKIPVSSDIELFIEENKNSEFIFITGTNGKSTVTALTGYILSNAGLDYHVGGNIGTAVMSLPYKRKGYILELSSFQIELLKKIAPKISVITNITSDHLDRYKNIHEYSKVKQKILKSDCLKIIGINSLISRDIYNVQKKYYSSIVPVSNNTKVKKGIYYYGNNLYDNTKPEKVNIPIPSLLALQGNHNRENIAISYAICSSLSVPIPVIIKSLKSFNGLEHRMQYIGNYKNISFYNDSKATNISSVMASLSSLDNIIWFAGGKFKGNTLNELDSVVKNIKKAYFFGENRDLFANFLEHRKCYPMPEYEICDNLEEAFYRALGYSIKIPQPLNFLLAPACSSYDQFKNFEERGQLFIKLTQNLKN